MSKQRKWEDILRSKLENYETDTHPDDWKAILDRLPSSKRIKYFHTLRNVAAVITGFLLLSGGYFFFRQTGEKAVVVNITGNQPVYDADERADLQAEHDRRLAVQEGIDEQSGQKDINRKEDETQNREHPAATTTGHKALKKEFIANELKSGKTLLSIYQQEHKEFPAHTIKTHHSSGYLMADAAIPSRKGERISKKRWGIGMGGGNYSVGTDGGAMPAFSSPAGLFTFNPDALRASANVVNKQNVSHKRPVSFGVGVGYALNDRWSVQSGLYYTMLKSEWWFVSESHGISKQRLHFLGIPLGVSYKIAEWKRLRLYTSAGGMTEWNMSGTIKTTFYEDNQLINREASKKETIRMKDWQWSVTGKVGVSYPVFKFVNAFVEGGGNYYFDTGSSIETIRTDKPFHLSLQAGIRVGF